MSKYLFEPKLPLWIGEAKEGLGEIQLARMLRGYKMFMTRFKWYVNGKDLTKVIEEKLFFKGYVGLYYDKIAEELYALDVQDVVKDPNNEIVRCSGLGNNGYEKKNLIVGKDIVIVYADITRLPPLLYVWELTSRINEKEDIISQQDNMLRKPILVKGSGLEFEELASALQNTLAGVSFVNTSKKSKSQNALLENPIEILNLQTNNSYKGGELWESRSQYEDLLRDYLGYPSVNNKKRERMITAEVSQSTSVAETNYKDAEMIRDKAVEEVKSLFSVEVKLEKLLTWEDKEVVDNDNGKDNISEDTSRA